MKIWNFFKLGVFDLSQSCLDRDSRSQHCQKVSLRSQENHDTFKILRILIKILTLPNLVSKVLFLKISTEPVKNLVSTVEKIKTVSKSRSQHIEKSRSWSLLVSTIETPKLNFFFFFFTFLKYFLHLDELAAGKRLDSVDFELLADSLKINEKFF